MLAKNPFNFPLLSTKSVIFSFLSLFFLLSSPIPTFSSPATVFKIEELFYQGRTEQAEQLLEESLQESPNHPQLLGLSASIRVNRGELDSAIALFNQAVNQSTDPHDRLVNLNNFLKALTYQERFLKEQLTFLEIDQKTSIIPQVNQKLANNRQKQTEIREQIPLILPSAVSNRTVARSYLNLGQLKEAEQALLTDYADSSLIPLLIAIAEQQDDPIPLLKKGLKIADLTGKVAIYSALAQSDPNYLPSAISYAQQAQLDEYLFQLYALQAKQGIEPKRSLKLAIAALSRLRTQLISPHPEVTFFFQDQVVPVYRQYLKVLLNDPTQQDLIEARNVFDRLQIAQVENLFRQLCLTQDINLNRVLKQNQAGLMQLIVLEDRYHVLLTLPDGEIKHHQVEISSSTLAQELIDWRRHLATSLTPNFRLSALSFYQQIIAPYETDISSLNQLWVIGDEYFRSIPLAALSDGEQYLIEKLPISNLLSWNLLVNRSFEQKSLLAFGLEEARPPFVNPIPLAVDEVKAIADLIPNSGVVVGENFTEEAFEQELLSKEPEMLHIAAHAVFTGDPTDSVLATYNENINLLELQYLLRLPQSLRLLVLSACETSQGNNLAVLGLAGVAARGGVENTLGTLWQSDDQASFDLMVDFYQSLAQGNSPAQALQQAQINAIRQGQHPAFWSLFLLIGG